LGLLALESQELVLGLVQMELGLVQLEQLQPQQLLEPDQPESS
jgi:hypothetical protein